ncbi:DNA-3-methyladenine glycosylase [Gephyromycinifex aptenodytis]|uniref:DNA-3-methyladenine glycosylase n=1 Tax=Gephyromycinifex aptenodytis TaxID=2716227 RepID=UPI0014456B74|nr:DNA-3-methyladenine glycosylase [Gephyromycinifex aptenodytis]
MTDWEQAPRLTSDFFNRPVLEVAPELLGATLSHAGVTLRLTEVEAYDGDQDPGSHAFRGRTQRTAVMFGPAGGLYVYFTYGMHYCANLVCGPQGSASAVLLRAGEVLAGEQVARARRAGTKDPETLAFRDLARGPARLTEALGVHRAHNGMDTTDADSPMIVRAAAHPVGQIIQGPRVGVSGEGGDGQRFPWRFWLQGEASVSVYRPAVRRARPPKQA